MTRLKLVQMLTVVNAGTKPHLNVLVQTVQSYSHRHQLLPPHAKTRIKTEMKQAWTAGVRVMLVQLVRQMLTRFVTRAM
jgi:hypothetical protein